MEPNFLLLQSKETSLAEISRFLAPDPTVLHHETNSGALSLPQKEKRLLCSLPQSFWVRRIRAKGLREKSRVRLQSTVL
jgi:hypothetical protein